MTDQRLKFIIDYIWATENEITIDNSVYALSGVLPAEINYVPRPSKILGRFSQNRKLFRVCVGIFKNLWNIGGAAIYFLYEMIILYHHSVRCTDKLDETVDTGEYALAFSSRAGDILQPPILGFEPKCWITFPWAPLNHQTCNARHIDIFSLLEKRDFFDAYKLAVIASRKLARRERTKHWTLQSYTAFRWFAVRIALEKLDINQLLIAEHYDRWAVLADKVVSKTDASLVLMQHGALSGLTLSDQTRRARLPFKLAHRLSNVTQLFVYDESSRAVFESDVLSPGCVARSVAVRFFQPMIELTQLPSEHAVKILFVGHPICEALHVYLYKQLSREYNVTCYYKPHPTAGLSDSVKQQSWCIVEGRSCFPVVEFLISYPSTLVNEYAASGISAVLHSLDHDKDFSSGLLESVKSKLDALACKKLV
ncbi:hypothetical protein NTD84_20735 [Pseudomonas sp. 14P_8.1_Bac3]|uniref:hypothetical protein n=1 Tax=Pseudomonas sp. 14P_8.1_Bac3 TaxID=2971621 RepID=UPI0021C9A9B8|nr:hypothetical protein [Pseudomonas sp. 14P_8.1_Bac3]MCU1762136.1 hypothetical protein [Pseudomonas sp. 14P_8.1_Bac3]